MSKTFTQVWQEAAELTEEERASLAGLLIDSLESEADPGVEEAWAAEIQKRVAQVEAGTAQTVPWEEVRQRLISRLNAR